MAIQECGNGHLYDTDQYSMCPYCAGGGNRIDFGGTSDVGKTVPVSVTSAPVGATVAPSGISRPSTDTGKTVGIFQKKTGFDPVVGWLVCVEGPERGKDYRIYGKNNTIGRGEHSDIVIKGDNSISRENHARLAYDKKHNAFHIIPADGANPVYLNDEPVYVPAKLTAKDRIEIGEYKLIFVPFCDDGFTWADDKKESSN